MRIPAPRHGLARALASALLVWMSGAVCLLFCASVCADAPPDAPQPAETSHACCKEREGAGPRAATGGVDGAVCARPAEEGRDCCILSARRSDAAPVPGGVDAPAVLSARRAVAASALAASPPRVAVRGGPVQNRGDTHLRCCVFLI